MEQHYVENNKCQRPEDSETEAPVTEVINSSNFYNHVGDNKYYGRFLAFFQQEMRTKPWENTINRHLFEGDELAEELLTRLFTREATLLPLISSTNPSSSPTHSSRLWS